MGVSKTLIIYLAVALFATGCQWDPPRTNPLDPGYYRYRPTGGIEISVMALDSSLPIPNAEVRIPQLKHIALTDSFGLVSFNTLPVDTYWICAERRGDFPYRIDSVRISVRENQIVRDTLLLEALPSALGSVRLRVLTLGQQPIADATVLITEIGRFTLTDANGYARFDDLPPGPLWLRAYREIQGDAIYGRDSTQVTIVSASLVDASINLDALPSFTRATANSLAFTANREQEVPTYFLRLKAEVFDPDGPADLRRVEVKWIDSYHQDSLLISLGYDFVSTLWTADVPSDSFYDGQIENALTLPFKFQAFDFAGNASPSTEAIMARVIHGFPDAQSVLPEQFPELIWQYERFTEFSNIHLFNYDVRIYRFLVREELVYDTLVPPINFRENRHRVGVNLPPGNYSWEVSVLDLFGNSSSSPRIQFNR